MLRTWTNRTRRGRSPQERQGRCRRPRECHRGARLARTWVEVVRACEAACGYRLLRVRSHRLLSGRMKVVMDDGTEGEAAAGFAFVIPPGHDAWVVGEEPCVFVDFSGMQRYAQAR